MCTMPVDCLQYYTIDFLNFAQYHTGVRGGGYQNLFLGKSPPSLSINEQSKYRRLEHQLPFPTYELLVSSSSVLIAAIDHC